MSEVNSVTDKSVEEAKPIYKQLLDRYLLIIRDSKSFDDAKSNLEENALNEDFIDNLTELLSQSIQTTDSLGRSYIVDKDDYYSPMPAKWKYGEYVVSAKGLQWFAADDKPVKIFFDLVPKEAARFMHYKSFNIAGVENQWVLDAFQTRLEQDLKEGKSYDQFVHDVGVDIDKLGIYGEDPARLNTVFRTNLFSAYTIGQLDQVSQMPDRFPMWRYVAILDDRTRESHRQLNGLIFKQGEGPIPPIDYNCRCTAQFLHIYEIERLNPDVVKDDRLMDLELLLGDRLKFDMKTEFENWIKKKKLDPEIQKYLSGD